ncbi:hypothetical protein GCM10009854_29470 [Saccharopolyspora halophila]|uniref:Uncharacterized protein n=1 Tax=Saccharopolyspora halophila TaxID=405551 RepID=A0ABN3GEZ7_9PSEU
MIIRFIRLRAAALEWKFDILTERCERDCEISLNPRKARSNDADTTEPIIHDIGPRKMITSALRIDHVLPRGGENVLISAPDYPPQASAQPDGLVTTPPLSGKLRRYS